MDRVAVVTGANRGIGLEIARQLAKKKMKVVLTSRNSDKGKEAAAVLAKEGLQVSFHALDVEDSGSIHTLVKYIDKEFQRLDILVNNAGVFLDKDQPGEIKTNGEFSTSAATVRRTLETNVLGPFQLCQSFIPLMLRHRYGRIVNLSSGMGQLSTMGAGHPAYRISKTALNAVTKVFAEETKGMGVLVNAVCPGWVRTDMGGAGANRSVEEGADTPVWLAMLPDDGPTGGYFRDRKPIPW